MQRLDFNVLSDEYNKLEVFGDRLEFVHEGARRPYQIVVKFAKSGLKLGLDFEIEFEELLSSHSLLLIGKIPNILIDQDEMQWFNLQTKDRLVPSEGTSPDLREVNDVVPRTSNKRLVSEDLPIFSNVFKVSILRVSDAEFHPKKV